MGSNKDIVIRNKFTVKQANVGARKRKGSRGSRPGTFVLSYMSRDENEATETLLPFTGGELTGAEKARIVQFLRRQGTKHAPDVIKEQLKSVDGYGGRSFGWSGLSLSDEQLRYDSSLIQEAYEEGHAVQLGVLSFSHKYLVDMGVVDADYRHMGSGSYVGYYDQMKLRLAITEGVTRLLDKGGYEEPMWVATVQADTENLHCHLAICDRRFSKERQLDDGSDRGKMRPDEMSALRDGISDKLYGLKHYHFYVKNNQKSKEVVKTLVKDLDFADAAFLKQLQLAMAQLPVNSDLWSYDNKSPEMERANILVESAVELARASYDGAEGLDTRAAVNNLYGYFKTLERPVDSTTLRVESSTTEELASKLENGLDDGFDLVLFEYNKRLFGGRRLHYETKLLERHEELKRFKQAEALGGVSEDARRLEVWYLTDLGYLSTVYAKYNALRPQLDDLTVDDSAIVSRIQMQEAIDDLPFDYIDRLGYDTKRDAEDDEQFDEKMERAYGIDRAKERLFDTDDRRELADLQSDIADYNLDLLRKGLLSPDAYRVRMSEFLENRDVSMDGGYVPKEMDIALNVDDVQDDFKFSKASVADISKGALERSRDMWTARYDGLNGAIAYLDKTGQSEALNDLTPSVKNLQEQAVAFKEVTELRRSGSVEKTAEKPVVAPVSEEKRVDKVMSLDTPKDAISVMRGDSAEMEL